MPDFLITNKSLDESWLVEVKYRKKWDTTTAERLGKSIQKQAKTWKNYLLIIFLSEAYMWGDSSKTSTSNQCGLIHIIHEKKTLKYVSYDGTKYSWSKIKWDYMLKINEVFKNLNSTNDGKTINKVCQLISQYPEILDD